MANIKNINGLRWCYVCNTNFPATNQFFHKDKNRPLGLSYQCKPCARIRLRKREQKRILTNEQKERKLISARKYTAKEGWYRNRIFTYKVFDSKKGLEFDLTVEWFIENIKDKSCIYCERSNIRMGCDRIDNSKGHLKSNVVPCCKECNITRSDMFTHEEMLQLGKHLRIIYDKRIKS